MFRLSRRMRCKTKEDLTHFDLRRSPSTGTGQHDGSVCRPYYRYHSSQCLHRCSKTSSTRASRSGSRGVGPYRWRRWKHTHQDCRLPTLPIPRVRSSTRHAFRVDAPIAHLRAHADSSLPPSQARWPSWPTHISQSYQPDEAACAAQRSRLQAGFRHNDRAAAEGAC
jgi:hypothetical protein